MGNLCKEEIMRANFNVPSVVLPNYTTKKVMPKRSEQAFGSKSNKKGANFDKTMMALAMFGMLNTLVQSTTLASDATGNQKKTVPEMNIDKSNDDDIKTLENKTLAIVKNIEDNFSYLEVENTKIYKNEDGVVVGYQKFNEDGSLKKKFYKHPEKYNSPNTDEALYREQHFPSGTIIIEINHPEKVGVQMSYAIKNGEDETKITSEDFN